MLRVESGLSSSSSLGGAVAPTSALARSGGDDLYVSEVRRAKGAPKLFPTVCPCAHPSDSLPPRSAIPRAKLLSFSLERLNKEPDLLRGDADRVRRQLQVRRGGEHVSRGGGSCLRAAVASPLLRRCERGGVCPWEKGMPMDARGGTHLLHARVDRTPDAQAVAAPTHFLPRAPAMLRFLRAPCAGGCCEPPCKLRGGR